MTMAARIFNKKQALEKEVKELYVKGVFANSVAATASAATTTPIVYTSVALGPARNTNTFTIQVLAAAANPTNTVLAAFSGSAAAITATITPNDGTNNPANTAATASLATTTPIVLTSVAKGSARNTKTFKTVVNAAAANPGATVLVAFTGTSSAIVCTVTPNDGTNNAATPVTVTTANLVQLINTGLITGKSPTITDASSFRILQTATGGDTTVMAASGEGDNVTGTFSGGVNVPVSVTTANLVQLINTGLITGKSPTITDGSSLRALQTATGGDTTPLADGGEGDGVAATFAGGDMSAGLTSKYGVASITRNGVGTWDVILEDQWFGLKSVKGMILKATGEDILFQVKSHSSISRPGIFTFITKTGGTATDPSDGLTFFMRIELKNTTAV